MDISNLTLTNGKGDGTRTACLMSARSLLDGRPFTDDHPSAVLKYIGIRINDGSWWRDDAERTQALFPLALDERLCASKCDASRAAEIQRARVCAHWALSFAAPLALDCAANALRAKRPESAALLSGHADTLRRAPTRDNALAARKDTRDAAAATAVAAVAYAAVAAAYAAAAVAAVAYAAVAYDAAVAAAVAADAADAAAVAAAVAADAAESKRIEIRDSLINLFVELLDVRA